MGHADTSRRGRAITRRRITPALALLAAGLLGVGCGSSGSSADPKNPVPPTVAVKDITVDPTIASVALGESVTLVATVLPLDASNRNVGWQASNGNVTLEPAGASVKVTGIAVGSTTITATTEDGGHVATAAVTVDPVSVIDVTLSSTTLTLTEGLSAPLTAVLSPANATDQAVAWTSSNASVATVTTTAAATTATVLALRAGTADISVTTADGGKSARCTVTVKPAEVATIKVTGVALSRPPEAVLDLEVGSTGALVATVSPDNATNKEVSWSSSTPAVTLSATTGSEVTLTGAQAGAATITAVTTDGARTATTGVKVWLLDAEIAATTAGALTPGAGGRYSTRSASGALAEQAVGKLLYYGADNAFSLGDADGGILLDGYASGSRTYAAAVGDSVGLAGTSALVQVRAYVGVPATRFANAGSPSVKVTVTAKAKSGSPRVALGSQGRVVAVADAMPADGLPHPYTFDAVPATSQIDVFDGGLEGSSLFVERIRVEPSATAAPDYTPPHDVEGLTTTEASSTSVTLAWTNPADADLAEVRITYGSPAVTVTIAAPATSFTAENLIAGLEYTFWIRTVDRAGYASNGVRYVRKGDPLLDETLPNDSATIDAIDYLVSTSPQTLVSAPGGARRLQYSGRKPFSFRSSGGKFMWVESTVDAGTNAANAVGALVPNPKGLVVIPASYTTPPAAANPSVRLVVKVSQLQAIPATQAPLGLILVGPQNQAAATWAPRGGGKILANVKVPDGSPSGTPVTTIVLDGLRPSTQYAIGCDYKQMFLFSVRVEPSVSSVADAPVVTVQ
jgi:uncharacterized protein YjdB